MADTELILAEVKALLERLEELMRQGRRVPWSRHVLVDEEALGTLVDQLHHALAQDFRQANWVLDDRRTADETPGGSLPTEPDLDPGERVREAEARARQILHEAEVKAHDLRQGALEYADEILGGLVQELQDIGRTVADNRAQLKKVLEGARQRTTGS
ncbi:H+-ATPase subunit H [Sulfobacillus acidophilus TPY]|uniref:ATPase n=1 Tax=Sulfobacillus acidophilus (strain ATCC 700253 / DSM 10332 / NAL) TaxID=679936 RepID=G8TVJ4_SULAD|nr:H+-ATPase subunit H [Sulfobacillus acidophilus TPY]AEW05913.1 hypothetical protein Sulac_2450 [Sulfobacillus acidophilus DSM 10332]